MSHLNLPIDFLWPNLILIIGNSDSHSKKSFSSQKINLERDVSRKKEKTLSQTEMGKINLPNQESEKLKIVFR